MYKNFKSFFHNLKNFYDVLSSFNVILNNSIIILLKFEVRTSKILAGISTISNNSAIFYSILSYFSSFFTAILTNRAFFYLTFISKKGQAIKQNCISNILLACLIPKSRGRDRRERDEIIMKQNIAIKYFNNETRPIDNLVLKPITYSS